MTHLPFVAASYAIGIGVPLVLAITSWRRLRLAKVRLAAIDPRHALGMTK